MTNYDPFEDTGDWPFRDAPPRTDRPREGRPDDPLLASLGETAVDTPSFDEPLDDSAPDEVAAEAVALPSRADEPAEPVEPVHAPAEEPVVADQVEPVEPVAAAPEPVSGEPAEERAEEPADEPADEPAGDEPSPEAGDGQGVVAEREPVSVEHAPGGFVVPPGPEVLEGGPHGFRRNVAVVVSRFNGDITSRMLEAALGELRDCHVTDETITVVPVPGAFELPLAALALAKTRRYSCIVALGCVIRGETAHFDLVAGEAASGLQLAAIETGIPVSFGVVTCETHAQAESRIDRAAEAVRTALEMADLFSHVRTRAAG